jgi:hypothetical protein
MVDRRTETETEGGAGWTDTERDLEVVGQYWSIQIMSLCAH